MAKKCHSQRPKVEVRQRTSCSEGLLPPRKVLGGCGGLAGEVPRPGGHQGVPLAEVLIQGLHSSQGRRQKETHPGPEQAQPVHDASQVFPPQPANPQRGPPERLLAGEDRSYRCLTSLPNQQFLPRLPSVPLGGKNFHRHRSALWSVHCPGRLPGLDQSPHSPGQDSGGAVLGLSRRSPGLCPKPGEVSKRPSLPQVPSGEAGLHHQPEEVPALPIPGAGMAGGKGRWQEPGPRPASGQGLQDYRHGHLPPLERKHFSSTLGVLARAASLRLSDWARAQSEKEAPGAHCAPPSLPGISDVPALPDHGGLEVVDSEKPTFEKPT